MKPTRTLFTLALAAGVALSGCTSKTVSQNQYSGFLSSYDGLEKTRSASGVPVMRWVDPGFDLTHYDSLVVQPLNFYPQPKPDARVDQQTLNAVLAQANQQMASALGQRLALVRPEQAGPRTLIFRGAITGVAAENQGLRPYEILPIALVLGSAMVATGERDQNTELFLEGELVENTSGKSVLRLVRKGFGKTLSNNRQKVTATDLAPVIDQLTKDALQFHVSKTAQ
ncbi:DUF3313 domain-containing protein [Pseudomonas sp. MAC6]|uniref:DUF3313 domain-containing protein n=1 Tax=Pseudomonas sp. MAC6 TaxID=3401633 RepID=UPI003BF5B004